MLVFIFKRNPTKMLRLRILCLRKKNPNKKILLRERKRHTAHCVVSTPSVVLTGYPLHLPGGYPAREYPARGGTLPRGVPCPVGREVSCRGYPGHGTPHLSHRILGNVAKHYGMGTPPWLDLARYPLCLSHGILGNVAKHYGIWVSPQV